MIEINSFFNLNIQGGLSFIYCTERERFINKYNVNDYRGVSDRTIGVPFGVELLFLPSKIIGLGFSIIGNINKPNSYVGCAVSIHCGKLRD